MRSKFFCVRLEYINKIERVNIVSNNPLRKILKFIWKIGENGIQNRVYFIL